MRVSGDAKVDLFTVVGALKYIDFSKNDLLVETMAINYVLPGAFSYKDLGDLYFDEYEIVLKEAHSLAKKIGANTNSIGNIKWRKT